jgi:hypothetical protein
LKELRNSRWDDRENHFTNVIKSIIDYNNVFWCFEVL